MTRDSALISVAGVDGCRDGWVCVTITVVDKSSKGEYIVSAKLSHAPHFSDVLALDDAPQIIAVDMPIGLPDRVGTGGRPPEQAVRKQLGVRQSSVFAIPSRRAVYAESYAECCAEALATSDPPRKISKQAFHIFPKIREIDALMSADLQSRVFECHPEAAFMQLNGGVPAPLPKKNKSRANPDGIDWRRNLLVRSGLPASVFDECLPKGVRHGRDDIVDAAACAMTAMRIYRGLAQRYPAAPIHDAHNLDMAIWA